MPTVAKIPFQPFSEHRPVRIYRTDLPHWRQDGCTYFVTFRLADSIPAAVINGWKNEKKSWLALHDIKMDEDATWFDSFLNLPKIEQQRFEKIFNRKSNSYLDACHGSCVLRHDTPRKILRAALEHFDTTRYHLGDYVIMPNHVHALVTPTRTHKLEAVLQSIKRFSSRQINQSLQPTDPTPLWKKHTHDHIVRNTTELAAYKNYIAKNPTKAKLSPSEYTHRPASYV